MKKSFSLLELIFIIVIISIISAIIMPKVQHSKLDLAGQRVILYLKYTRYLAFVDNKLKVDDDMWYKERWTMKFKNCEANIGGLYFIVYSDKNHKGHPNKNECAKDPITLKWLYSFHNCISGDDKSKYVLLTKEYGVSKIEISCNSTNTIGSISFGANGEVYSRLGINPLEKDKYKLTQTCFITLFDKEENFIKIAIEPYTGFIHQIL
jgi:hypothetical protein